MTRTIHCSQGHQWQAPTEDTTPADPDSLCPVCNERDVDPPPPSDRPAVVQAVRVLLGPAGSAVIPSTPRPGSTSGDATEVAAGEPPLVPGYEVLGELGRGGMGVVYQARQTSLGRVVALKMILAGAHAGPEARARFRSEAQAAASLQHPNIVQIHEVGEHQGLPYFALEFVDGGSLAQRLVHSPLSPGSAAELVETLARAVHAAHAHGIVHRDLKPANVLLTAGGFPKVADFGLAKRLDDAAGQTASGAVLGTPSYMAPEQAGGRSPLDSGDTARGGNRVSPAVDVYALGAILYETLTGRPPFHGASALETLEQVRTLEPVPPRRLQPAVPRDLETICVKCLAKDPRKRYPSAEALADDLHRFRQAEPIRARPVPRWERAWKWARRKPAAAALLLLSGLAAVGLMLGMAWHQASLRKQVDRAETNAAEASRQQQRADGHYREARAAMNRMVARLDDRRLAEVPRLQELREGQLEDALAFYQSILREGGRLDPAVQEDVAGAFQHAAVIQSRLDRYGQARRSFRQAADLLGDLAARYPEVPGYQAQLAVCYNGLGCCYSFTDPNSQAQHWLRRALALREQVCRAHPDEPEWQDALAESYHNLGQCMMGTGGQRRAAYEKALAIRTRLTRHYPKESSYAARAAQDAFALGLCYMDAKPDHADALYREAEGLLQPVVHDHPQEPEHALSLAALYINWAILMRQSRQPARAARLDTRAVDLAEEVLRKEPRHGLALQVCRNAHGDRAYSHDDLGRYADAIKDWDRLIELGAESELLRYRALRGWELIHAGDHAGAAATARALAEDSKTAAEFVYEAAKLWVSAGNLARNDARLPPNERARLAERHTAEGIALLNRLQRAGYFKHPANIGDFRQNSDLQRLRSRADFQEVLREMEGKK